MSIDLPSRFIVSWTAGRAPTLPKRPYFIVENPEAGPMFRAYLTLGATKREIRAAIARTFAQDRRDGTPPKVSGAYPNYVVTWEDEATKTENFILTIDMSNAAFKQEPITELARILRALAGRLESGNADYDGAPVLDFNGNTVGRYDFES